MSICLSKTGILLAAFGSASSSGEKALSRFASEVRGAFPNIPVRWAYTSNRMRNRLAAAGKKTDSLKKALFRMGFERYTHVAVQSLHLIPGAEYEVLLDEIQQARAEGGLANISVGLPLLHNTEDVHMVAEALLAHLPKERCPEDVVLCMGHGTWHSGAASYEALSCAVTAKDTRIFIGTLAGRHGIDNLLPAIRRTGTGLVWLLPLLSTIGKHAEQDMAGEHKHSWRNRIEAEGFTCKPVLKGTVEYAGFSRIWLRHLAEALSFPSG